MPRRKLEERDIRKLMRTGQGGRSVGLTLPKELVEELGWREKQKVVVSRKGKTLIIKDWKK